MATAIGPQKEFVNNGTIPMIAAIAVNMMGRNLRTAELSENMSPIVLSLNRHGIRWAGNVMNSVLISASLSAMLAAVFGLGRMIRSLALKDMHRNG